MTAKVTKTLGEIGRILASDKFDRIDPDDFTSSRFMLWRKEQRAIGEFMRQEGDEPRCIGFNSFELKLRKSLLEMVRRLRIRFEERLSTEQRPS